MDQMDHEQNTGEGNTIPLPTIKKREKLSKNWAFTLNNWEMDQMDHMFKTFERFEMEYLIGEEVGEYGTPHLQGCVFSTKRFRPIETFKFPFKPHWEACKGTKQHNITYCSKDGKYHTNMKIPKPLYCPTIYGWQEECVSHFQVDPAPSDRTIHWYWEPTGGAGKSDLVRYMCIKMGAIVCAGKAADMKYQIVKHKEKTGLAPEIIIFDVPRSMEGYMSYAGIEEIKNGIFASSKYESEMFMMNRPHVLVLANFAPEPGKEMSADRFNVVRIARDDDYHEREVNLDGGAWRP